MKKIYKSIVIELTFYQDDVVMTSNFDDNENFGSVNDFSGNNI